MDINTVYSGLGGVTITAEGVGATTKYYMQAGADAASKKLLGNPNIKSTNISYNWNGSAGSHQFSLTSISNYKNLVLFKSLFPVCTFASSVDSNLSYSYNAAAGALTVNITNGHTVWTHNFTIYYFG